MAKLFVLAFALSLDSFIVSIALGMLSLGRTAKRTLVLLFALCDAAASLSASVVTARWLKDTSFPLGKTEASALCFYALLIITLAWSSRAAVPSPRYANWFYALPFVLCLDNFVSGLSFSLHGVSPWILFAVVGMASAWMALVGLQIGSMIRTRLPIRAVALAEAGLLCLLAVLVLR